MNLSNVTIIFNLITAGKSLNDVVRECEEHLPFVLHSKDLARIEFVTMCRNHALALQGKAAAPHSSGDGVYDETAFEVHRTGNLSVVFCQFLLRLKLASSFDRFEEALDLSDKGEAVIYAVLGFPQVADVG